MSTGIPASAMKVVRWGSVTTLLVISGSTWFLAPGVSAQLGSLIVNMTSPASGASVSGTITVGARVTIVGALAAAGVQFQLDGVNLGAEDTTSPYSIPGHDKNK